MEIPDHFRFVTIKNLPKPKNALTGTIPDGIFDTDTLLQSIARALAFPAYFGENWNSLYDCLRDFHWSSKHEIMLIHEGLPKIPPSDLKLYLEILRDAAADWGPGEPHRLTIIFDQTQEEHVRNMLDPAKKL